MKELKLRFSCHLCWKQLPVEGLFGVGLGFVPCGGMPIVGHVSVLVTVIFSYRTLGKQTSPYLIF